VSDVRDDGRFSDCDRGFKLDSSSSAWQVPNGRLYAYFSTVLFVF